MMADHMGGVEVMGGGATELVRLLQAPASSMPDSAGKRHETGQKTQMIDSTAVGPGGGAAERPGAPVEKHENHAQPKREPSGRTPTRAKPPVPAPQPSKPESPDTASHQGHSMDAAAPLRRPT